MTRKATNVHTGFSFSVQSFYVGHNDNEYYCTTTKREDKKQLFYIQSPEKSYWDFILLSDEEVKILVVGDDLQHVVPPEGCEWSDKMKRLEDRLDSISIRMRRLCKNNWKRNN